MIFIINIVILDQRDLSIKDSSLKVNSYEISRDIYTITRSKFQCENIICEAGNLILVSDNNKLIYLGVIEKIKKDTLVTIECNPIVDLFNIEIPIRTMDDYTSNIITNLFTTYFIDSDDPLQNYSYLLIKNELNAEEKITLIYDDNSTTTFGELLNKIFDLTGASLEFNLSTNRQLGHYEKLVISLKKEVHMHYLTSSISSISNLVINESNRQTPNKLIFLPYDYSSIAEATIFYLLADNSITTDANDPRRFSNIVSKVIYYSGDEELEALATQELSNNIYNHNITFTMLNNNSILKPIVEFNLYSKMSFINYENNKTYYSIVTALSQNESEAITKITLGKVRTKLTEILNIRRS